jgi:N-terminal acetyltransferase B complex non-catalytic subunit
VLCDNGEEKLLLLAEGLLKTHAASHSLHEPEGLLVYISILEQQAKYGDAVQILSGKLGSLLVIDVDRLRIQGRLLARACDYAAAAEIFEKVLESCLDDCECFLPKFSFMSSYYFPYMLIVVHCMHYIFIKCNMLKNAKRLYGS